MSVGRTVRTVIICDLETCPVQLNFTTYGYLSNNLAFAQAQREGWRRDKLGRHLCPAHPKLKGAR